MRLNLFSAVALALVANLLPHRQPKPRATTKPRSPRPQASKRQPHATQEAA